MSDNFSEKVIKEHKQHKGKIEDCIICKNNMNDAYPVSIKREHGYHGGDITQCKICNDKLDFLLKSPGTLFSVAEVR